jgi:hypothetical protein
VPSHPPLIPCRSLLRVELRDMDAMARTAMVLGMAVMDAVLFLYALVPVQ